MKIVAEQNKNSLSNGSLMRIVPLAIWGLYLNNEELRYAVEL